MRVFFVPFSSFLFSFHFLPSIPLPLLFIFPSFIAPFLFPPLLSYLFLPSFPFELKILYIGRGSGRALSAPLAVSKSGHEAEIVLALKHDNGKARNVNWKERALAFLSSFSSFSFVFPFFSLFSLPFPSFRFPFFPSLRSPYN